MFCEKMIELFQKILVALQKPVDYIKKGKMLLTDIGGEWSTKINKSKINPMKMPIVSKEVQNK